MERSFYIIIFFYFLSWDGYAQLPTNLRSKNILPVSGEILLDTLSIVPGTLILLSNKTGKISDSLYSVNYFESSISFLEKLVTANEELFISYRVFSSSFFRDYYLRDSSEIYLQGIHRTTPVPAFYKDPFFESDGSRLISNGSISRGLTIGNQQDVIFNSQLNLQLSGSITDKLNIEAVISDNNIPLQPEGYSQKIQEFDKVYISIFHENLRLNAGDIELRDQQDYFLKIDRKAQGIHFSGNFPAGPDPEKLIETSVSGSVAKGRYTRNVIRPLEGNQGPYRLTGENNELFIVILAGSERVYMDGHLLSRGLDHDYVIDYNLAEIVFTANRPVNRNKRIIVEFEYSDRNYPRFMAYTKNRLITRNSSFHVGFYSEQDAKNQPLQQLLNQEQRKLLASIGDSLELAFVPKIDSVEFSNNYVLYRKTDTIVNATDYREIYVFSGDPASAHYRLNFSFLGKNKGNYIPDINSANGRVYKWIAPNGGIPQGTHEPVIFLATPKKQQVLSIGLETQKGNHSNLEFEMALSHTDLNTFSSIDNDDNTGIALRFAAGKNIFTADTALFQLRTKLGYELTGQNFRTSERYRPVEFERDWNVTLAELNGNQQLIYGEARFNMGKYGNANYFVDYFNSEGFDGFRNSLQSDVQFLGVKTILNASYLLTYGKQKANTNFLRHQLDISKPVGPVVLGFISESENNAWELPGTDSLLISSFRNNELVIYLQNSSENEDKWRLEARQRNDYIPLGISFVPFSLSKELSGSVNLSKISDHTFKGRVNYRSVNYQQIGGTLGDENSFSGRLEYNGRFLKGSIITATFMESLSGSEQKKEFFYLEVPAGQGAYKWVDYNGNGLKELDEFELAGFPDEADHIRVFLPTNQGVKTQINQLGQTMNIHPATVWRNSKGLKKLLSRFSNQFSFRTNQKIQNGELSDFFKILNIGKGDTSLVNLNANLRNTFSLNRTSPHFGADFILQKNWSKVLLVNGSDQRQYVQHILRLRWNPTGSVTIFPLIEKGNKLNSSEFFPARNYTIDFSAYETTIQYQIDLKIQVKLIYRHSQKENILSIEKNNSHEIKIESLYTLPSNFQLNAQLRFYHASYNAQQNTSIAYEMLEGLFPGRNLTWTVFIQKSLPNNLEITANYHGRFSRGREVIHTGGVQARAYF